MSRRWRNYCSLYLLASVAICVLVLHSAGNTLVLSAPVEDPQAIAMLASHEWERLPAAAAIARRYPKAIVVLTVPPQPTYWNCFRCGERVEWLSREGVDPHRVHEVHGAVNTYQEAHAVADQLRTLRLERLVIVTSPYHTRRSLMTFQSVLRGSGVRVGIVPAIRESNATPGTWWRYDVDRHYVLYEWAAIAVYGLRYGVPPF